MQNRISAASTELTPSASTDPVTPVSTMTPSATPDH
jgi:hypothetical protein